MTHLAELESRVRTDLETLGIPGAPWTRRRPGIYDVVIVGGGQSGLGAGFGLLKERVTNFLIVDENEEGQEGPWATYARMLTLRTPKTLTSIDLGIPSLTFRQWWIAQHGEPGWESLDKIPRLEWNDYLRWFRQTLGLPVENGTKLLSLSEAANGVFSLVLDRRGRKEIVMTRKVVLATGIQGGGEWHVPRFVSDVLPQERYAHTCKAIDYSQLAGKRIAILGAGASSFDNANAALTAGVKEAHVFVRRPSLPQVNPIRFMERSGVIPRFATLSDEMKYEIMASFFDRSQPPTNDTFNRAAAWEGFHLHLGAPWQALADTPDGVEITTPHGVTKADFLVLSTGLVTDPDLRPELGALADKMARWGDRFTPREEIRNAVLDAHPYLGGHFDVYPRTEADAKAVYGLFLFNYGALISLGLSAAAVSGLGYAIPRLARGIADQLFQDDQGPWLQDYLAYSEPEFVALDERAVASTNAKAS
ncbi:monoxygenase [Parvularcula bermudensis HTCC2503]|uniref:Monoxygenase n=1 Tax=Parvularcula bermudensis (strain ATCC BAA-594 / HTCC2503 / KCTC 12087) TaxID=314260 RepID=E0TCW9_PARBH|nr:NAD(P)/FAD-dependent oxidoreductase [Parvularcula bermudensis]ADM10352.1 monoxygenase [Parvularcula bermudensis HTCC2503]